MSFLYASSDAFGHCNFAKFDRKGVKPANVKADCWSRLLQPSSEHLRQTTQLILIFRRKIVDDFGNDRLPRLGVWRLFQLFDIVSGPDGHLSLYGFVGILHNLPDYSLDCFAP